MIVEPIDRDVKASYIIINMIQYLLYISKDSDEINYKDDNASFNRDYAVSQCFISLTFIIARNLVEIREIGASFRKFISGWT